MERRMLSFTNTILWWVIFLAYPTKIAISMNVGIWGGNGYTSDQTKLENLTTDYGFSIVSTTMKAGYAVNTFLPRMEAAGWKAILRFSASQDSVIDGECESLPGSTGGQFSLAVWKQSIQDNLYFDRQAEIQAYIDKGVLLGVMIADDVKNYGGWGFDDCDPTLEEIGQMGQYIKENFPGLQVWIRLSPSDLLERAGDATSDPVSTLESVDVAVAQFTSKKYEITTYTSDNQKAAKELGIEFGCGLNIADGGDGTSGQEGWKGEGFYTMTAEEVENYGSYMISNSCCQHMLLWEFDGNEIWPDGTIGAEYFEADEGYKKATLSLEELESGTCEPSATPPSSNPTSNPTKSPTQQPTLVPTINNPPTSAPTSRPTETPTHNPTAAPTSISAAEPTANPTSNPTNSPTDHPTKTPTCTCAPTSHPTGTPTLNPTKKNTNSPTERPTMVPTDQKPDEDECQKCMDFLSDYDGTDDSKAAEKECKVISGDKVVQKACKKVVKDVLKKGKDKLDSCKTYGWCPTSRTRTRRTAECVCEDEPTSSPTNAPTRLTASEPTSRPTSSPTNSPTDQPTMAPTIIIKNPPTCAPTSFPTGTPTRDPTSNPTSSPTEHPTLVPTDPKPDEGDCAVCMNFLSKHEDADDSKAAEKECKTISTDKVVQKACKKVVKDVLKKGKDKLDSCKIYGWCPNSHTRAFLRARRTAGCEEGPTSSPILQPTKEPATPPTQAPTINTPAPTIIQATPPTKSPSVKPTAKPTAKPTSNITNSPTLPKAEECADCLNFLRKHDDADDSKAAEKECKIISSDKVVQKACKKVVKDVLKKGKDEVDTCKVYGWCS